MEKDRKLESILKAAHYKSHEDFTLLKHPTEYDRFSLIHIQTGIYRDFTWKALSELLKPLIDEAKQVTDSPEETEKWFQSMEGYY